MTTDIVIAENYLRKQTGCKHEFTLTFNEFKRIYLAKQCYYLKITLTRKREGKSTRQSDFTLDRIDNTKGYVKGNVVACSFLYNNLKSQLEDPKNLLTQKSLMKALGRHVC